jgi:hypothetical protein
MVFRKIGAGATHKKSQPEHAGVYCRGRWLAGLFTCCNTRSSQGVLPMFIGFGHACVSDEEDWGRAGR